MSKNRPSPHQSGRPGAALKEDDVDIEVRPYAHQPYEALNPPVGATWDTKGKLVALRLATSAAVLFAGMLSIVFLLSGATAPPGITVAAIACVTVISVAGAGGLLNSTVIRDVVRDVMTYFSKRELGEGGAPGPGLGGDRRS
jgi:hypothetical protein